MKPAAHGCGCFLGASSSRGPGGSVWRVTMVEAVIGEARARLTRNDPDALVLAEIASALARRLPPTTDPKTLPPDLWIEARLLLAQAHLAQGNFVAAARTALEAVGLAETEGSGDALLSIEMEAMGALLALADGFPQVSLRRWRSTQRLAAQVGEPDLEARASHCHAFVEALARDSSPPPPPDEPSTWRAVLDAIASRGWPRPGQVVH